MTPTDDLNDLLSDDAQDAMQQRYADAQDAKAKRKASSESTLQKRIADFLVRMGFMVTRINSSVHVTDGGVHLASYRVVNTNATAGHADLLVCRQGRAWYVEVKTPTGKQSPKQREFQDTCIKYGMPYYIVRSIDEATTFARQVIGGNL